MMEKETAIAQLWHLISFQSDYDYVNALGTKDKIIEHYERLYCKLKENIGRILGALTKVGLSDACEKGQITFNKEMITFKFPELCFKLDEKEVKTQINIAPCGGTRTSSRIITIPNYKGGLEENAISSFFNGGKELSDNICKVVGQHYHDTVGDVVKETIWKGATFKSFDELEKYNLYIYIIGGFTEAFRIIVEHADNKAEMEKIVLKPEINTCLKILRRVIPGKSEESRWFKQETTIKEGTYKAIFGFSGRHDVGNFVGLAYKDPYYVTRSLMLGVMPEI